MRRPGVVRTVIVMQSQPVGQHIPVSSLGFAAAAVAGLLHGTASLYWAIGGRWQLESVGDWAVELVDDHPIWSGVGLGLLAVLKALAATVPALNERQKGSGYRAIRLCSWAGGVLLVAWGGLSTMSAWAVLAGVITPDGGYDRATMVGHAVAWDPLFLIWGGALLIALWTSRRRTPTNRLFGQR